MIINNIPLIELRNKLNQTPEQSNFEVKTSEIIMDFFSALKPDQTIRNLGGHGLAFVFKGKEKGKNIMFRAEMDAIPVSVTQSYNLQNDNHFAHYCGHDGHMSILAGLGVYLSQNRPEKGKVILLFQPAEENGKGARNILDDVRFKKIAPDYIFGYHNLPAYPMGSIICREGVFCAASAGIKFKFKGQSKHAADELYLNNPLFALSNTILEFHELNHKDIFKDDGYVTIVGANSGKINFGSTPAEANLFITIRAVRTDDFEMLLKTVEKIARDIAMKDKLGFRISLHDEFNAVVNDDECLKMIKFSALRNDFEYISLKRPNLWSEDFGYFLENYHGAMFCIGAGEHCAPLHTINYRFPDEIIEPGIKALIGIIEKSTKL